MTNANSHSEFETLLEYIRQSRGFDFTGYKRSTITRRVLKRMHAINIESYGEYLDYLEVHPEEFNILFNTLLINVTAFFRDRAAWDYLSSEVIPRIMSRREPNEQIRIWSAGCASGEEAYTTAMAIADVIGVEEFRDRVKIYATDVDEEALAQARLGMYSPDKLKDLSDEQLALYFEQSDGEYSFRKDLRRSIIFGRHDLIQDAPISRLDLLICRNALMYFNAETQARIVNHFHFALRDEGFLFLGKAETLLSHGSTFAVIDLKCRIFTRLPRLNLRDHLSVISKTNGNNVVERPSHQIRLREAAFDSGTLARLVLDANGALALANERARNLFNLSTRDLARPLQDLELSYRPVELRSCVEQVYQQRRTVNVYDALYQTAQGETIYLDVQVSPLFDPLSRILGISITFIDVTCYKRLREELEHANQELEMAYEELQSANEELETTNEELQSSNEELETTNEELQSSNEELETMNEELQSTNEELQTLNDELQRRSKSINQANTFLESILASLRDGVVVVDRNLQVQIWNHKAEDLWGLRTEEAVGQNLLNLDIGLPVAQLLETIRECLAQRTPEALKVTLEAINRRGRTIHCSVSCSSLMEAELQPQGAILLMEEREEGGNGV
ncbi:MAG: PAS domain-containing protein [Myxacorys californica WJT36-NPBG1]|jgi:two-component system CheB/CheR fusion protein|nr:PAS domain-containing protein [Myxacorys californica WJT36-NPBG1]